MSEEKKNTVRLPIAEFKRQMGAMIGTTGKSYQRSPRNIDAVGYTNYTIEDIEHILGTGHPPLVRDLSRYFYRFSGIYRRVISYYANLLLYYTMVSPKLGATQPSKNKIKARFNKVLEFVDSLNLTINCNKIVTKILAEGAYYGFFREYGKDCTFQDLPIEYCRSRYKNESGIDILEFDLRYFETIRDEADRKLALSNFPREIVAAYHKRKRQTESTWVAVPANLGAVFYYHDFIPFFAGALIAITRYNESLAREADRDEEELQKILINEMPIGKDDELVFSLEESAVIHDGIAKMLSNNRYLDVLTAFGSVHLEQAQESKAAAALDNTNKFNVAVFDGLGVSSELFNAKGNLSLGYSVEKDTALMMSMLNTIMEWVSYQVNLRFGDVKLRFDVEILPVTIHNKDKMTALYTKGAQYGYSKFFAGVSLGIKQSNLISLISVENDVFDLTSKMIPLQSSHTMSGTDKKADGGGVQSESKPGRPELDEADKSDKTIANENSQ